MNRQEIVKKVSEKLGIDESVIDAVYMHQTSTVHEKVKDKDTNEIFFPGLGSIFFRPGRGVYKLIVYEARLKDLKLKFPTLTNKKSIDAAIERMKHITEVINILKWKVSYEPDKYNGIRMNYINNSINYFPGFADIVNKLREQRKYGFTKEDIPEPEEALGEQTGDSKSLSELLLPDDEIKETESRCSSKNMQDKYMRSIRSQG